MAFFRIKSIKSGNKKINYLYFVENHWDKKKKQSRQKVVLYIGKVKDLEPIKIQAIFQKYNGKCACGRRDTLTISKDLKLLCFNCNKKNSLFPLSSIIQNEK